VIYVGFFLQEKFRDVPMPVLQCDAKWPFAIYEFVDVRASVDVFSHSLELSQSDCGVQGQLGTGASALFSEELSDGFVTLFQRYIEWSLVHVGGGVDVCASIDDRCDDVYVPTLCCDVQRSPLVGEANFLFGSIAQDLLYLRGVGGVNRVAKFS